ncbi:MAG TPA: cell division protein SepF [Acidimicrobiales bacterium]|nr:cell division protein SepF [Acidimicrobiales bacterium]
MSSFMNRALAYLGLKDIDEEEFYSEDALAGAPTPPPERTVYPEPGEEGDTRGVPTTVRPIGGDPHRAGGTTAGVVRPIAGGHVAASRVHVVAPAHFRDAQEIGDLVKQGSPVIVNLQLSERDLARRMIDFCSGLTYALDGQMEKVADQVFLLAPSNVEVSPEERMRLQQRGLYRP